MAGQRGTAVLAYAALFLGLCQDCAGLRGRTGGSRDAQSSSFSSSSSSGVGQLGGESRGPQNYPSNYNKYINNDINSGPTVPNFQRNLSYPRAADDKDNNTSSSDGSATVKRPSFTVSGEDQGADSGATLVCAYRVLETTGRDKLCFRATQHSFQCQSGECQRVDVARGPSGGQRADKRQRANTVGAGEGAKT